MAVDLLFRAAPYSSQPVHLIFGEVEGPVIGNSLLSLSVTLPAPGATALIVLLRQLTATLTLPGLGVSASLSYDNAVLRGPTGRTQAFHQVADHGITSRQPGHNETLKLKKGTAPRHEVAIPVSAKTGMSWYDTVSMTRGARLTSWTEANKVSQATSSRFTPMNSIGRTRETFWQEAMRLKRGVTIGYADMLRFPRPTLTTGYDPAKPLSKQFGGSFGVAKPLTLYRTTHWQEGRKPPPGLTPFVPPVIPDPEKCYYPPPGAAVPLVFADPVALTADLLFVCGTHGLPPAAATKVVPIRSTYIVLNVTKLTRVVGNIELPATSLSLNIDMDSWTWSFSASLPSFALDMVRPTEAGPVAVRADVNGNAYLLMVEGITRNRAFGSKSITISGRGQSAALADPYTRIMTFENTEDRTARQLLEDALAENGQSIGWEVDWRITDWLVPAGAWRHQGNYMSAANAIASAAGAFVQPDPLLKKLRVRARFPEAPWKWYDPATVPDLELPTAAVITEGISWSDMADYNAVYVSGTTAGGVLGHVYREGTAADNVAQMVTDALITHADAARQRGTYVLAETGRIARYTLSLPVLPESGVIEPGTLLRYTDEAVVKMGVVKGVSVTTNFKTTNQTIEVQVHD